MKPNEIKILIACECSGTVRDAFRARGFHAFSCDLKPDESPYHFEGDVREILSRQWHALIAHPPCTFLCNSGVCRLAHTPPNPSPGILYGKARWDAMGQAARFFRELWQARIEHIALENPIMHGHARKIIDANYRQTIQPYHFGEDASKRTALWLKNLPPLIGTKYFPPRAVCRTCGFCEPAAVEVRERMFAQGCPECGADAAQIAPRWSNQTDSGQNKLTPSAERGALRAVTYPGIADAMAKQWGDFLQR